MWVSAPWRALGPRWSPGSAESRKTERTECPKVKVSQHSVEILEVKDKNCTKEKVVVTLMLQIFKVEAEEWKLKYFNSKYFHFSNNTTSTSNLYCTTGQEKYQYINIIYLLYTVYYYIINII